MAAPQNGREQASHYEVLSLTPDLVTSQPDPTLFIKRAYHRALLKNHPDKASTASSASSAPSVYSVDQITKAWEVLSSPAQRAEYDAQLRLRKTTGASGGEGEKFHTGVENVDLDDLEVDQVTNEWFRSCRCGNERGYVFTEDDLMEAGDDGSLMVGCQDCSLWLRVHFAILDEQDDEDTNAKA